MSFRRKPVETLRESILFILDAPCGGMTFIFWVDLLKLRHYRNFAGLNLVWRSRHCFSASQRESSGVDYREKLNMSEGNLQSKAIY